MLTIRVTSQLHSVVQMLKNVDLGKNVNDSLANHFLSDPEVHAVNNTFGLTKRKEQKQPLSGWE
ncbi:hypothetical protein YDYSG_57720 [Paenibacillus tyrfis]|uniref:hypothetical protein n=1 Tax=Paenibacillus tyrfis TaxID=1501230 RepID=UPI0024936C36|nr:hypothetical protein [Paenibacillus tyrfis]GLI09740.1 hypothetical protein YDYSG_57720 [Paenibacillus tyrfis]